MYIITDFAHFFKSSTDNPIIFIGYILEQLFRAILPFCSKVQKNQRASGDDKFIVSDNEVDEILSNKSESEMDSEEDEENSSSGSDSEDERRKRLDDRKKKKGGDVLAWMSRRPPVKVIVQTSPRAYIQDMAQYR